MDISTPEIISLALTGAMARAAQLRATNTQPDALAQLEQSVIPELLSVLSRNDDTSEQQQQQPRKKKKKKR